jgi:hypothetical protein
MPARATAALQSTRSFPRWLCLLLFLGLVLVYHANASVVDEGDAVPSVELPYALLETGKLAISPERSPKMFKWRAEPPLELPGGTDVRSWDSKYDDKTLGQWHEEGHVALHGPRYFLVAAPQRDAYVNTFGPVPGLLTLPLAALVNTLSPATAQKPMVKLAVAKLTASMLIAACAVLILVTALRTTDRARSLLLMAVYALGSCAWSMSSQTIWQQTATQFFLMLGAAFFLGAVETRRVAACAGLAFGAALAVRPTAAVVLLGAFVYLCLRHPRSVLPFVFGALPATLAIATYNFYFFGNPFVFAQGLVGHAVAIEKTGSPELWQTPLWQGLLGLLVSPSRGLLVFSPVFALAGWGIVRIWKDVRFDALRPLTLATLVMMGIQCKWFDWWGGWAYGYRPWFDVLPFLTLFLLPVLEAATATTARRAMFSVALVFSIFVQALGAFSYDKLWNERELFLVRLPDRDDPVTLLTEDRAREVARQHNGALVGSKYCNIDFPECRYRLWTVTDNLILYQLRNYRQARARRLPWGWTSLWRRTPSDALVL